MSALKVLLVISEVAPIISGIARSAARLQQGLRMLGYHVDTISLADIPRYVHGEVRLSSMLWKGPGTLLPRLDQYDIVNVQGPVPTFSDVALLFSVVGRHHGRPLVVYTHHSEIDLPAYRVLCDLYNWAHKQAARLADQVLVSTPSYARDLARYIPAERIAIVPWGIDTEWYDSAVPKADDFTVLFVGQLRPYKGLGVLLRAVARVPGLHLQIIGGGHHEAEYRALAAALDLGPERVTFHGRVTDADLIRRLRARARHCAAVDDAGRGVRAGGARGHGGGLHTGRLPAARGHRHPRRRGADLSGRRRRHPRGPIGAAARRPGATQGTISQGARGREFSWQRTVYWHHAHYERLAALHRFDATLRAGRGEGAGALQTLLHDSVTTLDASSGSIMLVEPRDRLLHLRAARGLSVDAHGHEGQPLTQGIAGFVASHNIPLVLPQGIEELRGRFADLGQRPHIHSSLSVPIQARDRILGVMNLSSYTGDRLFRDDDLHWLSTLAQRTGRILAKHTPAGSIRMWDRIHLPADANEDGMADANEDGMDKVMDKAHALPAGACHGVE